MITNIQRFAFPSCSSTGTTHPHRNLVRGHHCASKGEVGTLPTGVVIAFLESLIHTPFCLSHPIVLVSNVYSELREVCELSPVNVTEHIFLLR